MVSSLLPAAALLAVFQHAAPAAAAAPPPALVPADTAWMLVSTALVLLMTPGVAFFYGGLVRAKNALNTMMMCMAAFGVCGIVWALLGYTLAFGTGGAFLGDLQFAFLNNVGVDPKGTIPHALFMAYQASFAVVTATLIAGAIVDRMRFGPYLAFIALWTICVYAPIAHWVWGGGWLSKLGVLDFAGGTVVHINAGVSALVAAVVLGPRKDYGRQAVLPHNVPFVLLGAGLLWFGWFGFNGGSALAANELAALAFSNTFLAPMATLVVWTLLDYFRTGRATAVGAATGIVVGLVAITPAAGFVSPTSAVIIGVLAGAVPFLACTKLKAALGYDDALDTFGVHGVGGTMGALLTGFFATPEVNGNLTTNLSTVVGHGLWLEQLKAMGLTIVLAVVGTVVIAMLVKVTVGLRPDREAEEGGLDQNDHGEAGYHDQEAMG